jgi:outer membrane protein assembly factor BamB
MNRIKGGIVNMSSCSFNRIRLPLLMGMMVILGWLGESANLQAQSTEGTPNIQKKWTFNAPGDPWLGEPTPTADAVYFITSDDHLIAIDSITGQLRWRFDPGTGKRHSPEHEGVCALSFPAPAVFGALVLFSSSAGSLYAIEANTGARKWSCITEAVLMSEPVFADGKFFFWTDEGDLYALDAVTGTEKWKVKMPCEAASILQPTEGAGVLTCPCRNDGSVIAFDLETGRQRWKWNQTVKGDDWFCHGWFCRGMRIKAVGYTVFIGTGACGQLVALDSLTGKLVWNAQLQTQQDNAGIFLKAATLDTVIAQTEDGNLYALSAVTGEEKWRFQMAVASWSTKCAIEAGTVYIIENNGNLQALEEDSGKRKWDRRLVGQIRSRNYGDGFSPPQYFVVANGVIYVVTPDGTLTAYVM